MVRFEFLENNNMARFELPEKNDYAADDVCPGCKEKHTHICIVDCCNAPGTMSNSVHHRCSGETKARCVYHFMGGDLDRDGALFDARIPNAKEQEFIRAAREDGIEWRGERMEQFADICNEVLRKREMGVVAYRQKALKKLKAFLRR